MQPLAPRHVPQGEVQRADAVELQPHPVIQIPTPDKHQPFSARATQSFYWRNEKDHVWLMTGGCEIRQGGLVARARDAVVWVRPERYESNQVTVYLEGEVQVVSESEVNGKVERAELQDDSWYASFLTLQAVQMDGLQPQGEPLQKPAFYARGLARKNSYNEGLVKRTQFQAPADPAPDTDILGVPLVADPLPEGTRRLRAFPRSTAPVVATWYPSEDGREWIAVIDSGVNLIIEGVEGIGAIDVSTDRLVLWTAAQEQLDLSGGTPQRADTPLEIYMEGNVIFRQGERIIHAERMYYDVTRNVGTILQAEILSPVRSFQGLVRLRADVIQQTSPDHFVASNAYITSSRLGRPGYRLAASDILFQDEQVPVIDPATGQPAVDPFTGEPIIEHRRLATTRNNVLFVEEAPVFYWPVMKSNLERPEFYIRRLKYRHDEIFGHQAMVDLDPYQILNIDPIPGTDWEVSVDYLSKRGLGHGTRFGYNRADFELFGMDAPSAGFIDYWGIKDDGVDVLGGIRNNLPPEEDYRFRLFGRHRSQLPNGFQLTGELGWISDRNFLEQYFENEYDTLKDMTTGLELKQVVDSMSWSIFANAHVNDFFTETQWTPLLEHNWLGVSLFQNTFTWYSHTSIGYADYGVATVPTDPRNLAAFGPLLPWEVDRQGERFHTRQEIDLPLQAGPFKIVPYALGEFGHWGEDLAGNDYDRLYGKAGIRASLPIWTVDPTVENHLFNLHGLAHKVVFEVDANYSDANQDLFDPDDPSVGLPLYDALNDTNVENFVRRAQITTYNGSIPLRFDQRTYGIRSGLQDWVTSPSAEVVDDLEVIRFNVHQRWQTKRGMPGQRRIQDWIVLNTGITYFPDETRDNFGEPFGLSNYDFRWHLGDRTTITSDGVYDFFADGQRFTRVSLHLQRPPRGHLTLSFSDLHGPINSQVVSMAYSYHMTPKYISSFSTSYDFGEKRNIGQSLTLTRIGESFLISFGFNVDQAKDNFGVSLSVAPRFLPSLRFGDAGMASVPIAGLYGLE